MSNYAKKVAIVGATGTVGKFITEALLKTGKHEVTAISREGSDAPIPAGVSVARVDYSNPASLEAGLRGQDVLIITMSTTAPPDTSIKLVEAAAAAGVPYVLPNEWCPDMADQSMAMDVLIGEGELKVRKRVEELGKSSWVGMITGFWYEYSLGLNSLTYGMDWKARKFTFFDDGETIINTITWPQTGRAVAALLSLPITADGEAGKPSLSDYKNKFVYTSSFAVNQKQMYESVLRVSKTKPEDWTIEYEPSEKRFQDGRTELFGGNRMGFQKLLYSRVFFKDGNGYYEKVRGGLANDLLGLPKEDLDEATAVAIDRAERGVTYHQAEVKSSS